MTKEEFFSDRYKMDYPKRGAAVIINNRRFNRVTGLNDRNGTDTDASALAARFYELGFEPEILHNQSAKEMQNVLEKCKKKLHVK